jgi:hypothetical protein
MISLSLGWRPTANLLEYLSESEMKEFCEMISESLDSLNVAIWDSLGNHSVEGPTKILPLVKNAEINDLNAIRTFATAHSDEMKMSRLRKTGYSYEHENLCEREISKYLFG